MITIITGDKDSGKTRYILNLFEKSGGKGFCQPKVLNSNREIVGYNILDLHSSEEKPLLRVEVHRPVEWVNWTVVGREKYCFNNNIQREFSCRGIEDLGDAGCFFIDEVGIVEMEGKGYWPLIEKVVLKKDFQLYITVRPKLLNQLKERLISIGIDRDIIEVKEI